MDGAPNDNEFHNELTKAHGTVGILNGTNQNSWKQIIEKV